MFDNLVLLVHSRPMPKPVLGRGLGALLGGTSQTISTPSSPTASSAATGTGVERIAISRIKPCSLQPRKVFPEESLIELADSIREQGIVQPLLVRKQGEDYELIAGERRWRAAQRAGLLEVPVVVRVADDRTVLELALIENLQRENLNPLEEANGYSQLTAQFGLTQEEVATRVGKNRTVVANALRLLRLPAAVQNYVRDGRLSVGHAKAILGLNSAEEQALAAEKVLRAGLNVRETEEMVNHWQAARKSGRQADGKTKDPHVTDLEQKLRERLGTKVGLRYREGKGALEIRFYSNEELDRILNLLGVRMD